MKYINDVLHIQFWQTITQKVKQPHQEQARLVLVPAAMAPNTIMMTSRTRLSAPLGIIFAKGVYNVP